MDCPYNSSLWNNATRPRQPNIIHKIFRESARKRSRAREVALHKLFRKRERTLYRDEGAMNELILTLP